MNDMSPILMHCSLQQLYCVILSSRIVTSDIALLLQHSGRSFSSYSLQALGHHVTLHAGMPASCDKFCEGGAGDYILLNHHAAHYS